MSNQNNEYVELQTIINDHHFYINWPTDFIIDQSYNNLIIIKSDIRYVHDVKILYDQIDDMLYTDLKKLIVSYLVFDKIHFSMTYSKQFDKYYINIQYNYNKFCFSYYSDRKILHQYQYPINYWCTVSQYDTINESDPNHIALIILYDVISRLTKLLEGTT
jgi:hypothetical protein